MITLTVGFSRNPRLEPLFQGAVKPQHINLEFVYCPPGDLFYRNLRYDEFDVSEMSISDFLITRERRDATKWQWSGLPVFLSKAFLWYTLSAHANSGIETLADLRGKRVAVPDYPMTAAVWMRSVFKELYGINTNDITWYNGRTKDFSHSGVFGFDKEPPAGITLNWLNENQTMDQMLDRGEIDAAYGIKAVARKESSGMKPIDRNGGTQIDGNPRIRPLLKDGGRQVTLDYFRKTGVMPSNHMVIVKTAILEKHPWIALELFKTFQRSKELSYEWAAEMSKAHLMFEGEDLKKQAEIYGADPYPLGLKANRKMLELLARCSVEQGLTKKPANIDELFFPVVRDT